MENLIIVCDNDSEVIKKKVTMLSMVVLNRLLNKGKNIEKIVVTTYLNGDDDKTIKEVGGTCEQITEDLEYMFGLVVSEINFLVDKTKSYKHTYNIQFH